MKKIKFLGAALLAASLIFSGCANGSDDDVDSTPDTEKVVDEKGGEGSEENGGSESGSGEETGSGEENSGEGQNSGSGESSGSGDSGSSSGGESSGSGDSEDSDGGDTGTDNGGDEEGTEVDDSTDYEAPDLSTYYKKYLVSSPKQASNVAVADWGAGCKTTPNDDGTYTIVSSGSMWGGVGGICAPFTNFEEGTFAKYEYIVFTVDTTDYVIDYTKDDGNYGVNVKIAKGEPIGSQQKFNTNYVANGKVRTYYAPISSFTNTVPPVATEMAILIGGEGTIKLNEVYLAAAEDPANIAITGITITPESATVAQGGTQQFTVKDSNFVNLTNDEDVAYTISGDAAVDSTISDNGLLTVGTTAGNLTVTATYTVEGETFTASATITVMEVKTNLVSSVELEVYTDAAHNKDQGQGITTTGDFVTIENNTVTLNKPNDGAWGEWSCQLFLKVSASEGKIFEAGKRYYVSVTVNSTASLSNCVWKEDLAGKIDQHGIAYDGGEAKTLTAEFDGADLDYFKCLLSFPGEASTIIISDVIVYDITE